MRVRLRNKPKPDSYTESCGINVADGWRERNVWYPGRPVWNALKEVTTAQAKQGGAEHAGVSRGHSKPKSRMQSRTKDRINRSL